MESVLSNFDIENKKNFWKLYPSWKTPKLYKDFYTKDKSKGKEKSSDIMWGLIHLYDKSEMNPYRAYPLQEKQELIATDIFDNEKYDWSKQQGLVDFTALLMQTEEERELASFEAFMQKRRDLITKSENDMDLDNLKALDDARKRNKENLAELQRLKDLVSLKADNGINKGGIIESAKEKGLL